MYTATTHGIKVTAQPVYLEQQSSPRDSLFVWAYTIELQNLGDRTVQLINRYWHITDASGKVEEVRGPGVIGAQPVLKPGESFQYVSGASLHCSSGIMYGSYEMEYEDGERFEVEIPAFSLDSIEQILRPN